MSSIKAMILLTGALGLAASGCFGDGPGVNINAADTAPDSGGTDAGGTDSGSTDDTSVDAAGDSSGPVVKPLPNACADSTSCTKGACRSGVCVEDPPAEATATITDPNGDISTDTPPNLECVGQAPESPDGPQTATLYGAVARFGSGLKTYDIQVDVFAMAGYDPSACESVEDLTEKQECYAGYGTPIGTDISEPAATTGVPGQCSGHSDCPLGYRCVEGDLDHECKEQYGLYEIADMPTNVPLILRATPTKLTNKWHVSYVFNVYLYADAVDADGRYHYDATIVSDGQWFTTPNTVGLPPIPATRGVVGGRVRDCRLAGERSSWAVDDVSMAMANPAEKIVFFNDLEDDTVPLDDRVTTNILGRFAALNVEPGWNELAGSVRVGGEVVPVGAIGLYVYPDALTVVSFPGMQPHWPQN